VTKIKIDIFQKNSTFYPKSLLLTAESAEVFNIKLTNFPIYYIFSVGEKNMNIDIRKDIEIAKQLLKKYNGKKLILFGSHADGSADESSDIDFAVDINHEYFFKFYIELEEQLNKKIDLILISSLMKKFRERIEEKGVLCVG
jgi:predicted nucleotidyltransferase